jgi:hypothetical protein
MVKQKHIKDMRYDHHQKKSMVVLDAHKTKAKTSTYIGTVMPNLDFSSLCINMAFVITAITTADNPLSILHQSLMKFIRISTIPSGDIGLMQLMCTYP